MSHHTDKNTPWPDKVFQRFERTAACQRCLMSHSRCSPTLIGKTKHHFAFPPLLFRSSVGQDCYTRLWSLKDGHLLRTIPSPHPAANDLIPSVVFSSKLGGCRGLPGLLMAVKHDLYYFPYNTDYQEGGEQQAGF